MADAFDEVVARLYAVPPEDFVAARTEAAKLARDAGDRLRAVAIAKLRKPTLGAWLVNLLAHERPDLVADLLALGDELRTAQRELRGGDLRELSQRRRETVTELARQSRALAIAAGRGVRDTLPLAEVEATLIAALAEPAVAEDVRAGRLTKTVEYAGFGETPRPRLTLVQGGLDAGLDAGLRPGLDADEDEADEVEGDEDQVDEDEDDGDTPADDTPVNINDARSAAKKGPNVAAHRASSTKGRATAGEAPGRHEPAKRAPGKHTPGKHAPAKQAPSKADRDEAEEERLAREAMRAEAERRAAERAAATELRKARAAAHRELLSARTQLAEAEAARTAAERAVLEARRRVEKALARASEVDRDGADD